MLVSPRGCIEQDFYAVAALRRQREVKVGRLFAMKRLVNYVLHFFLMLLADKLFHK